MDLCDIRTVRALLERHGFRFSHAKGQNFLVRSWVPEAIAEAAGVDGAGVLEVGPGIGCLTEQLCRRAAKVVAVEVDQRLRPVLAETVGHFPNLTVRFADVLKEDLPALVRSSFPGLRPAACANLPYYITTPVLTALLESRTFSAVTVMVQKEVAQRICAAAGTAAYGAFTVFCRYHADPQLLFDVPPDCFLPRPKVTSSVLRLDVRPEPPCPVADPALFFRVVRASFAQRRKTLLNGLSAGFPNVPKAALAGVLSACGLPPAVRGETLDLSAFAAVADALSPLLPQRPSDTGTAPDTATASGDTVH